MKKMKTMGIILLVSLYLAGCGSPDRNQENGAQAAEETQEIKAQNTEALQPAEHSEAPQEEKQHAQTEWDGETENLQEHSVNSKEDTADAEEGGEYKATFLGADSSHIQTCKLYHGKSQEEINVNGARGKYLIQMLSGFLENPDYDFWYTAGLLDLEYESLEEMASSRPDCYYVFLQFNQKVSYSFLEKQDHWTRHMSTVTFCGAIIEVERDALSLNWKVDDTLFYPIMCNVEAETGFLDRFKEWEQTKDWQEAFAGMEEECAELEKKRAEAFGFMAEEGTEEDGKSQGEGYFDFLGIDGSVIQSCKIYHGENQQELALSEGKGQEFLKRLSVFLAGKKFSDGPDGMIEGVSLKNLGNAAQENEEDYYILLEFEHPVTVVLDEKPEGKIQVRDSDMLLIEVCRQDRALRLIWHHPDMEGVVSFLGNIGIYEKKVYKNFLRMYEEWESDMF